MEACSQSDPRAAWGLLCALPEELGALSEQVVARRSLQGLEVLELDLGVQPVLALVCGVGKVRAAQAASLLFSSGASRGLFVVGVCGGLRRSLPPGTLVHCTRAAQTDLAVREDREFESDLRLRAAWREEVSGVEGWFLTADRPVLSLRQRVRLARAFLGPCVADMETAAAAAVAARSGVPWAALRAVTDPASGAVRRSFERHYPSQAGRAADTLPGLLRRLAGTGAE